MNYVHSRGFLSGCDEVQRCAAYCTDLGRVVPASAIPYYEALDGSRRLVRVEKFVEHMAKETGLDLVRRCRDLISNHYGIDVVLFKDKINFRHPKSPGFGAHQDAAAGWDKYGETFYSVVVFLLESNPESGGFEFSVEPHGGAFYANQNGRIPDADFDLLERVDLLASAGDAAFFDSHAAHRTYINSTATVIPHIILTFNPASSGD